MERKKGEVWRLRDPKKGDLTVKFLEDVPEGGGDVDVEIVDGPGLKTGDSIRIRTSVVRFLEKLK